jgi:hypothetical protein
MAPILTTRVTIKVPKHAYETPDCSDTHLEVSDEAAGGFLVLKQGDAVIRLDADELEALAAEGKRMVAAWDAA